MKTLWKKILVVILGFSNLAVLGLVFHIYFDNHQNLLLFSSGDDSDLIEKIEQKCTDKLRRLLEDQNKTSTICSIKMKGRDGKASYKLRTKITVRKSGSGLEVEGLGRMTNTSHHATEADWCNDCDPEKSQITEKDFEEVLTEVIDMAEGISSKAQASVQKAQEEYSNKDARRKAADEKVANCEGVWNEETEKFKRFDRKKKNGQRKRIELSNG